MPHFFFKIARTLISVDYRKKDGDATFEEGDAHRTASMRFANLSKVGRFGTFGGTGGGIITRVLSSSSFSSANTKTNDAKTTTTMMQQKPADQKRVALGVACGLVACAIPFLFKDVQKRELEVSRARDGGGGGGGERGGFGDGKEEARKERLMTTSKSGGRKRRE